MKVGRGIWWRLLLSLVLILMAGQPGVAAEPPMTIRVVFNTAPNPPIVYGSGTVIDPDKPSLIVELLRMVGQRTGIAMDFQRVPWQRGLYMIETGQADAIFASSFSPERMAYGVYPMADGVVDSTRMIHRMSYSLFVRPGSNVAWTGQTITGLRAPVGAIPEFAVVPMLKTLGVPLDLEPSTVGNLRKLANGRIDAYAEIDTLAQAAIRDNPDEFGALVKLSPPLRTTPYYLMFSKIFYDAHPEWAERVWDTIAQVRATPDYQSLVSGKYAN
jgi:polar amino acid transport system substrate-binding protein